MSFAVTNVSSSGSSPNVNVEEIAGTTTSVDNGTADAGTQRVVVASDNDPINVSVNNFPVTQPVSGPLTDTELRATAVPVSGTVNANATLSAETTKVIGTVNISAAQSVTANAGTNLNTSALNLESTQSAMSAKLPATLGAKTIANSLSVNIASDQTVPVSGTFFQATQPVSAASLPLPTGAATAALQTQPGVDIGDVTINNASGASAVNIQDGGNSITVDGTVNAVQSGTWNITNVSGTVSLPTGAATSANQTSELTKLDTLHTDLVNVEGKQDTGNASLSSIDGKVPANLTVTSTRLLVDGSGVTQPVSDGGGSLTVDGTVAATQSGTWNINNISGTVSLPTGAATETTLSSLNSKVTAVNTGAVVVSSSALPSGAATSAKQDTGNTSVASIDTKILADTTSIAGTLSATVADIVELNVAGYAGVVIQVGDGHNAAIVFTVHFESTIDGTNWIPIYGCDVLTLDGQTPGETNFERTFTFNVAGQLKIRARSEGGLGGSGIAVNIRAAKNPSLMYQILAITFASVAVTSTVLAADASTATLQTAGNVSTASIDTKLISDTTSLTKTLSAVGPDTAVLDVEGYAGAVILVGTGIAGSPLPTTLYFEISADGTNWTVLSGCNIYNLDGQVPANSDYDGTFTFNVSAFKQIRVKTNFASGVTVVLRAAKSPALMWQILAVTFTSTAVTSTVLATDASTATLQITGNSTLTSIDGHVDGLETLVTATNTKLDTLHTDIPALNVAQNSTTSGQTGPLAQTATTTSPPTYTTAKTNPLSTDIAGNLRVSNLTALPAGSNVIGHVISDIGSTTAVTGNVTVVQGTGSNLHTVIDSGTVSTITNVVHVDDNSGSLTVDNGGTFAVQATVAAGATNIAKAEDVGAADGDVGVPAMAVRKATPANTSGTDGDYEMLQMSAGRLWTSATIDAALPAGTNAIGKLSANSGVDIGDVDVTSLPALVAGTALIGKVGIDQTTPGTTNKVSIGTDGTVAVTNLDVALSTRLKPADTLTAVTTVTSLTQMNGAAIAMGTGTRSAGTQRVTVATDDVVPVTNANLDVALSTRLKPADTLTAVTTVTSLTQMNGAAIAMGTGTRSAGTQRVTIATDDVVPVTNANLDVALSTRLKPADTLTGVTTVGTVTAVTSITNALPAGTNRIGSVRPVDSADADLTSAKSTQTSRAIGVQPLRDAGRTHVTYYATGAASGTTTTETAISLTKSSGTSATSAANSQTPASGKKYRITAITVASRGNVTATAQVSTFNLRINTAGAVITSSTPVIMSIRSATPATALAWDRVFIEIPEGLEIAGDGTLQIGMTANAVFVTNAPTWDVLITGYEY